MNKQQQKVFKQRIKAIKVPEKDALAVLGVNALDEWTGSLGDALNKVAEAQKQDSHAPSPQAQGAERQTVGTEVVTLTSPDEDVVEGSVLERWGSTDELTFQANRARSFFGWARNLPQGTEGDRMVLATLQYARLIGANPASEIHAWWDEKNQEFSITPHYSYFVKVARAYDPHMTQFHKPVLPGEDMEVGDKDIAARCYILTEHQQNFLKDLLDREVPYDKALKMASTSAIGVVRYHEHTWYKSGDRKDAPKGWTWMQRAETRALRNAVRRAFGTVELLPGAQDNLQAYGLPTETDILLPEDRVKQLAAGYAEEEEAKKTDTSGMEPDEVLARNAELLHGEEPEEPSEGEEIEEGEVVEETAEAPEGVRPGPTPREPGEVIAVLREAAGWTEKQGRWLKASDELVGPPDKQLVKRTAALLNGMVGSDEVRYDLTEAIFDKRSLSTATDLEVSALVTWAELEEGVWEFGPIAQIEAKEILKGVEADEGEEGVEEEQEEDEDA